MIVVDASVVVALLLRLDLAPDVEALLEDDDVDVQAPHLLDVEVLNALRRFARSSEWSPARLDVAVRDLRELRAERWPTEPMVERIWARRDHMTAYDAAYVVLAETLGCALLTRDERLARAPGLGVPVTVV